MVFVTIAISTSQKSRLVQEAPVGRRRGDAADLELIDCTFDQAVKPTKFFAAEVESDRADAQRQLPALALGHIPSVIMLSVVGVR